MAQNYGKTFKIWKNDCDVLHSGIMSFYVDW